MTLRLLALLMLCLPHLGQAEPVFDVHVHIRGGEQEVRKYLEQAEAAKLELAGFGAIFMAERGKPAHTREKNDELLALARQHPGLLPVGSVHPYDGQAAADELARVAGLGMKVVKLHPHTQQFDAADPRVLEVCRQAGQLGLAVLFDNANILPGDSEKLFNLALQAHGTQFVFTHLGGMNFRFWNILPLARTAEGLLGNNINFDISAVMVLMAGSPIEEEFVWTLRNVGIDHILLGSDFPQFTLPQAVAALEKLDLSDEEKARIRYGNARRLFGL
ncbi:amidohydrolase family protein [Flavobacterium sp. MXW15]|uniref:Amidohydrolase family protein n=1 Tax=Xanthomonas chitinilytica TaxID=2989819 RepID=A0ABT3JWL1_9XANT|nr:amidohydrolase family protein [Xanthomonas sp. H13-6]MCW4455678.1 amidohydrolase family protein [Flavobacterium sp. MXW15]MCW4472836.1 amidohydrolase family protein [Xanthomonas sp. H13-6]